MAKRLFLFLFYSLTGLILAPEILVAESGVPVSGVNFRAVETAEIVETPVKETPVQPFNIATTSVSAQVPTRQVVTTPQNVIRIAGKTIEVAEVGSTEVDAGNHVNKFREKFLYGHNSAAVFGGLKNLNLGETFSISLSGVTKNYRINEIVLFEKTSATTLAADGQSYKMAALVKNAKGHDLMLMTCAGTDYGNGDASHRLVIFADEI